MISTAGSTSRRTFVRQSLSVAALAAAGAALPSLPGGGSAALAEGAFDLSAGVAGCGQLAFMVNVGSGYDPAYGMLDTFGTYGIKSSMFVMGWLAEQNPLLVQAIAAWGHPVGSHGHSPPELTLRSDDDVLNDLASAAQVLSWAMGYPPVPWLTPFAAASDWRVRSLASELGYVTVGYSITSDDWDPWATADSIYSNVMSGLFDGAIIELHLDSQMSVAGTAVALPWIIEDAMAQGYRFVTIQQIAAGC
jgi:peptidoglycan/xylan/chitin deacetylase (PgdA/CDA1 family)